jgi:ankyrin repeat protein
MGLVHASRTGNLALVKELLDDDYNIHIDYDQPLLESVYYGHVEVVRLLLDRGANIHADNNSTLRLSIYRGHVEVVRLLLDRGADISDTYKEQVQVNAPCIIRRLLCSYNLYDYDSEFFTTLKHFGLIRRRVNTLEQLCRKTMTVNMGCVPDKIELFLPGLAEKKFNSVVPEYLRVPPRGN